MPSRSSGMKDMDTPRRMISRGRKALQRDALAEDGAAGDGLKAGDGLAEFLLAAAGNARHAEDLAGGDGKVDVVQRLDAVFIDDGEVVYVQHRRVAQGVGAMDGEVHRRATMRSVQFAGGGLLRVHRADAVALAEDGDAVGDVQHLVELVGDDDDGAASSRILRRMATRAVDLLRGKHGGGLVQHQRARAAVKHLEDLHGLLLADGEGV